MGDLKLNSSGGGSVTLTTPSTASTYTQTLQAATGTVPVAAASGTFTTANFNSASTFGFKNRLINGAMAIDQRNGGASYTVPTTANGYTLDRWNLQSAQSSKISVQQNAGSVTPPSGFTNYLGITSLSAYSPLATDYFDFVQCVEGYNIADFAWGTANAKAATLQFWAYSSLTGTFSGSITNSTGAYSYVFNYSIPVANTWTFITVTIAGPTVGTWLNNNGTGVIVRVCDYGSGSNFKTATIGSWVAGNYNGSSGSVSVVGTNGATFYVTGVQFEAGSVATGFDYRPYGTELMLCQRYCQVINGSNNYRMVGQFYTTTAGRVVLTHYVTMRSAPTLTVSGSTGEAVGVGATTFTTNNANQVLGVDASSWDLTGATAARTAYQQLIYTGTATLSAEL